MDIEDLSKTQLLLLTILVNFVTAIATAVMTVSLLDEAPQTVTQTVNRIVERTVETAVESTPLPSILPVPPKEPTVVVREEDRLAEAIRADASRRVLIHRGATTSSPVIAVGTYLPDKRVVITAASRDLPREALIEFADGSSAEASLSRPGATLAAYGFSDGATLPSPNTAAVTASSDLAQGQTIVSLTQGGAAVAGIISLVSEEGIRANVTGVPAGAAAVSSDGNLIGIASFTPGLFIPAERINTLLSDAP